MSEKPPVSEAAVAARPDELLDGVGASVFAAYNAMQTTKRRHYALLSRLDEKRSRYGLAPTAAEDALLAALLRDHDAQVKRFTEANRVLKADRPDAIATLFGYLTALDAAGLDPASPAAPEDASVTH